MNPTEISRRYGIVRGTFLHRTMLLGIGRKPSYTQEEINIVLNFKYHRNALDKRSYQPNKIQVIELFLTKDNGSSTIAKALNLEVTYVNKVINEYLKEKTITVISKP